MGPGKFNYSGRATLVAGTVTLAIPLVSANTKCVISIVTPGGTLGIGYDTSCTANQLVITSIVAAGTIQVLDTSVVDYILTGN